MTPLLFLIALKPLVGLSVGYSLSGVFPSPFTETGSQTSVEYSLMIGGSLDHKDTSKSVSMGLMLGYTPYRDNNVSSFEDFYSGIFLKKTTIKGGFSLTSWIGIAYHSVESKRFLISGGWKKKTDGKMGLTVAIEAGKLLTSRISLCATVTYHYIMPSVEVNPSRFKLGMGFTYSQR